MDLDQHPGAEYQEDLLADTEEGGDDVEETVFLFEHQPPRTAVSSTHREAGIQDTGDEGAGGGDQIEKRESVAERTSEDEDRTDTENGAEVPGPAELSEAPPLLAVGRELEPDGTLDREDDVVAGRPDDDEDHEGRVRGCEVAEAKSTKRGEEHRHRRHLCLAEEGQHRPGDEHDQKAGKLPRKLEPATGHGIELMDLCEVVVQRGHEDARSGPEEEGREEGAFEIGATHVG